jgi:hypothetical protein
MMIPDSKILEGFGGSDFQVIANSFPTLIKLSRGVGALLDYNRKVATMDFLLPELFYSSNLEPELLCIS